MQIKGIRVPVVVAVVVLVLAILLALQYVYHKFNVEEPLFKLDRNIKAVQKMEIDEKAQPIVLTVVLNRTNDLRQTYLAVYDNSKQILGNKEFTIELRDRRNKDLEDIFYRSQFVIYEALAKGNFTAMAATVEKEAGRAGAEARIFIDDKNVYLQITKGDNYLYEVIARQEREAKSGRQQQGSEI